MAKAAPKKPTAKVGSNKKPAAKAGGKKTKAKKAPTPKFEIDQEVIFAGYREDTPEEERVFEEGDRLTVKAVNTDNNTILYTVVRSEDSEAYDENPDSVEGSEVLGSEIKKAPKGKAKVEPQPIEVKHIGEMKKLVKSGDLLETAKATLEDAKKKFFYFGGLMSEIYNTNKYAPEGVKWIGGKEGREAWEEFCLENFGMKGANVRAYMDIYNTMSQIESVDVNRLAEIGWSKSSEIAKYITADNAEELLDLAEEKPITELKETLKTEYLSEDGKTPSGRTARGTTKISKKTFSFSLFEDQAAGIQYILETAQKTLATDTPDATFEHIVNEWASDHLDPSKVKNAEKATKKVTSSLKKAGIEIPSRKKAKETVDA